MLEALPFKRMQLSAFTCNESSKVMIRKLDGDVEGKITQNAVTSVSFKTRFANSECTIV